MQTFHGKAFFTLRSCEPFCITH